MQKAAKIAIALIVVALIAVLGLIAMQTKTDVAPEPAPTESPAPTEAPEEETAPEEEAPVAAPDGDAASGEEMYEGALAGKTEEEIGQMAMAEEGAQFDAEAGEGAVD